MADLQGLCTFPAVKTVISASFTLSHGITPSVATIECAPQEGLFGAGGTLLFTFGSTTISFSDCKVDLASLSYNAQGLIWHLSIFDRRWKWAFGDISGSYNERRPDGTVDQNTIQTPQQLAMKLLEGMGETLYDVSAMPNETFPEALWLNDVPAKHLADLADSLGCRVCLNLDDSVSVVRTGIGADLPTVNVLADSFSVKPPERPDSLRVVCGKTRYQPDFLLEAVGVDTDGKVKLIDKLSYKPAGGWGGVGPDFSGLSNTPGADRAPSPRTLAQDTVYRWYRVKLEDPSTPGKLPLIPGWFGGVQATPKGSRIQAIWQVLPLEEVRVGGYIDEQALFHPDPALVFGQFYDGGLSYATTGGESLITTGNTPYKKPFHINRDSGIVEFSDQVFILKDADDGSRTYAPAILGLRTACTVRHYVTRVWDRAFFDLVFEEGNWGTGPKVLKHDEIVLTVVPTINSAGLVTQVTTNTAAVAREADHYLQAQNLEYQHQDARNITYIGLVPIGVDGAVQQVSWSIGPRGATTQASRNNEFHPAVPPYKERRLVEQMAGQQFAQLRRQVRDQLRYYGKWQSR